MKIPLVDLQRNHTQLEKKFTPLLKNIIHRSDFILGQDVTAFECEFASYCHAKFCIGVSSGTDALHLALKALGLGPGDEVITAANTFIATVVAISLTGAKPVLADVDPTTYTLDPSAVKRALTKKSKAIVPIHLYGQAADMDPLLKIAQDHGLVVVEDACQAHGATYKGRSVGTLGDIACFSFYPSKNLGACGDGGAVVTNDSRLAKKISMLRQYGQRQKYHHEFIGYNNRLDTLQAAFLRIKLKSLTQGNKKRRFWAKRYGELLSGTPLILPEINARHNHVYHLYVVRYPHRNSLQKYLQNHGIATGIHYPIPIHRTDAYRHLGYKKGVFPVTEMLADEILSLPMFPELQEKEVRYVSQVIRSYLSS